LHVRYLRIIIIPLIGSSLLYLSACTSPKHYQVYQDNKRVENAGPFATDKLLDEFETTERVLHILEKATGCLNKGEFISKETFRSIIGICSDFTNKRHQEMEDRVIFPFLKSIRGSEKKDFLGRLLMDHVSARDMIREISESINTIYQGKKAKKKFTKTVNAYLKHVRKHIQIEKKVLFSWINKVLDHEEQLILIDKCNEKEREFIQAGMYEKYTAMIEKLEEQPLCP